MAALPVAGMILYVLWSGNIQSKRLNLLPVKAPPVRPGERNQAQADLQRLGPGLPHLGAGGRSSCTGTTFWSAGTPP